MAYTLSYTSKNEDPKMYMDNIQCIPMDSQRIVNNSNDSTVA